MVKILNPLVFLVAQLLTGRDTANAFRVEPTRPGAGQLQAEMRRRSPQSPASTTTPAEERAAAAAKSNAQ